MHNDGAVANEIRGNVISGFSRGFTFYNESGAVLTRNQVTGASPVLYFGITASAATRVFLNDFGGNNTGVVGGIAIELSDAGRGNFWGRECSAGPPYFDLSADTNNPQARDSHPYGIPVAALEPASVPAPPGCEVTPVDADSDGYASLTTGGDDCDDLDPNSYPGAAELCDEADNDCDGAVDNGVCGTPELVPVTPTEPIPATHFSLTGPIVVPEAGLSTTIEIPAEALVPKLYLYMAAGGPVGPVRMSIDGVEVRSAPPIHPQSHGLTAPIMAGIHQVTLTDPSGNGFAGRPPLVLEAVDEGYACVLCEAEITHEPGPATTETIEFGAVSDDSRPFLVIEKDLDYPGGKISVSLNPILDEIVGFAQTAARRQALIQEYDAGRFSDHHALLVEAQGAGRFNLTLTDRDTTAPLGAVLVPRQGWVTCDDHVVVRVYVDDRQATVYVNGIEAARSAEDPHLFELDVPLSPGTNQITVRAVDRCQNASETSVTVFMTTTEVCNGRDDDCNGLIDEGFDVDGDTYTTCGGDCDDTRASVNPDGVDNTCDGLDNDCDGNRDGPDPDSDTVGDLCDNCPAVANTNQANQDGDNLGDACDPDRDGDGVLNASDNCPTVANAGQDNYDSDGAGDACDADDDNDGVLDTADTCPRGELGWTSNASTDADADGCRDATEDLDDDGDGVPDASDNCLGLANPGQENCDSDGVGDACDPDHVLNGLTIAPGPFITMALGQGVQLTVTGQFGDCGDTNVTLGTTGTTYDPSSGPVAVSANGYVSTSSPPQPYTVNVTAWNGGFSAMVTIHVIWVTAIDITPSPVVMYEGDPAVSLAVDGTQTDGAVVDLTLAADITYGLSLQYDWVTAMGSGPTRNRVSYLGRGWTYVRVYYSPPPQAPEMFADVGICNDAPEDGFQVGGTHSEGSVWDRSPDDSLVQIKRPTGGYLGSISLALAEGDEPYVYWKDSRYLVVAIKRGGNIGTCPADPCDPVSCAGTWEIWFVNRAADDTDDSRDHRGLTSPMIQGAGTHECDTLSVYFTPDGQIASVFFDRTWYASTSKIATYMIFNQQSIRPMTTVSLAVGGSHSVDNTFDTGTCTGVVNWETLNASGNPQDSGSDDYDWAF